ncbi:glutathione-dependent disulfide-bond oxidoreductase [Burkholderia sp. Ac-20379]|uniref:glutathione-dependent disulfide-bond oxidoreductase n=1 Tax=Burkholderia sp. Ac-20379 TaxID=2703900 RepID=UPI00197D52DE|nr:glutathione-dependent disulfide-bond oxidoreductase [Burkholderia sp. Ac-20379]MBN3725448.1 glutathione-dependent disulfide-bond oxidoreductase [Burkholderia sp. Ac-20379]
MNDDAARNLPAGYVPPTVWIPKADPGGAFGSINRPTSGARFEQPLPVGKHPLQLYSQGTPNGQKVTILLEELLAAGHAGAEYDAWLIDIFKGDQFGSGFVAINPNGKIPALVDRSIEPAVPIFESGSILVYLAERFGAFLPTETRARTETFNWLMWQMGAAPFVGGGLGHFYAYAPLKIEYAIDRYAMETRRQLHVLDTHLASHEFLAGGQYTIADMAVWPWYPGSLYGVYGTHEFLAIEQYPHLLRWYHAIAARPAVARGRVVNRTSGAPGTWLRERHDAGDFNALCQPA